MFCRSLSCALDQSNCDVAEQKMQKVPSFLLRCLLNCGRVSIFAPQSRTKDSQIGRLAQLVQSVCLTSRGSGVRIPQRPHSFRQLSIGRWVAVFLCVNETERVAEVHASSAVGCVHNRRRQVSRRVFLHRGGDRMQFLGRAFAQSPKVLGVSSSRNRSMGGVVFGKRRREKEKRGEMLSISSLFSI